MNYKALEKLNFVDKQLTKLAEQHGYQKIFPKSIDNYAGFKEDYKASNLTPFKLIDREGEINILHEDPTISLFQAELKTDKLFYLTKVFSWDSKYKENLKGGLEILGSESDISDVEIIVLSYKFLESLGVENFYVEIGHSDYIQELLTMAGMEKPLMQKINDQIHKKNSGMIRKYLKELSIDENLKQQIADIPKMFGSIDEVVQRLETNCIEGKKISEVKRKLKTMVQLFKKYDLELSKIKIDFSLTNKYSYYNGIIFKAYTNNYGKKLLQGGRYTLNKNQKEINGVGFGFNLREILGGIKMNGRKMRDYTIMVSNANVEQSIVLAEKLRKMGYTVKKMEDKLNFELIQRIKSDYILEVDKKMVKVIDSIRDQVFKKDIINYVDDVRRNKMMESIH